MTRMTTTGRAKRSFVLWVLATLIAVFAGSVLPFPSRACLWVSCAGLVATTQVTRTYGLIAYREPTVLNYASGLALSGAFLIVSWLSIYLQQQVHFVLAFIATFVMYGACSAIVAWRFALALMLLRC